MNEIVILMSALVIGILLGSIFYGGLWLTIRKGIPSEQPALWFLCSFLVRTSIVLSGFYYIGRDHWDRLLVCLLGFFMTRLMAMRFIRVAEKLNNSASSSVSPEARHAP